MKDWVRLRVRVDVRVWQIEGRSVNEEEMGRGCW
jgi:hypothetical protein